METDASMVEINPSVLLRRDDLLALDARGHFDGALSLPPTSRRTAFSEEDLQGSGVEC